MTKCCLYVVLFSTGHKYFEFYFHLNYYRSIERSEILHIHWAAGGVRLWTLRDSNSRPPRTLKQFLPLIFLKKFLFPGFCFEKISFPGAFLDKFLFPGFFLEKISFPKAFLLKEKAFANEALYQLS